jgi:hypothetical protein
MIMWQVGKGSELTISAGLPYTLIPPQENVMPRTSKTRAAKEWEDGQTYRKTQTYGMDAEFAGWVNCSLGTTHKEAYENWLRSAEALTDFQAVVDNFYRLTVGIDVKNDAYVANAFMRSTRSPHAGKMTSQRSADPYTALMKLVFAISHVMPENWQQLSEGENADW